MEETRPTRNEDTSTRAGRRALAVGLANLLALLLMACGRTTTEGIQADRPAASSVAAAEPAYGPLASIPATEHESWNAAAINWQPYEAGMKRAKAENKPVCLIFYANWCPHCQNYSHVFENPKIVEKARGFVMIHINADDDAELSRRYARDGAYVPRTFFLAPDGAVQTEIHAPRPQYAYFYDEHNPASLLAGMDAATRAVAR